MQKIIFLLILFATVLVLPVSGQQQLSAQTIFLFTDKTAYYEGDVITVTGSVDKVVEGLDISLQIFANIDGTTNLVEIAQVGVTEDGQFTKTFVASGPQWQNEGTIIIKATYGKESNEINFKFFMETGTNFISSYEVIIPEGGGTFDVNYTLKGGMLKSILVNQNQLSLDIDIDTDSNGALDIEIPRNYLDSIDQNGLDSDFIVLIYADNVNYVQTAFTEIETNDKIRSLYIPLKNGDEKIQIIGTHVVPEFGTIAAIILAVAITSIIVLSTKTKFSIFTKL